MYPLDDVWINCLKNLNVTSMSPLDKCPLAPSDCPLEVVVRAPNNIPVMHEWFQGFVDHSKTSME